MRLDDLIARLGLDVLPAAEQADLQAYLYELLEERVGRRLASRMSEAELEEFEALVDGSPAVTEDFLDGFVEGWRTCTPPLSPGELTDLACGRWLEIHAPDYRSVVGEELASLEGDLRPEVPAFLAASRSGTRWPRRSGV